MLILKTLYRFFAIDSIIGGIKKNIGGFLSTTSWIIGFLLVFLVIGSITLKYYPGISIPLSETINQLVNETLQHKLIIFVFLVMTGVVAISGIVSLIAITIFALYLIFVLSIIIIYTPKTLINRFKNILKRVKAENEDHKDTN